MTIPTESRVARAAAHIEACIDCQVCWHGGSPSGHSTHAPCAPPPCWPGCKAKQQQEQHRSEESTHHTPHCCCWRHARTCAPRRRLPANLRSWRRTRATAAAAASSAVQLCSQLITRSLSTLQRLLSCLQVLPRCTQLGLRCFQLLAQPACTALLADQGLLGCRLASPQALQLRLQLQQLPCLLSTAAAAQPLLSQRCLGRLRLPRRLGRCRRRGRLHLQRLRGRRARRRLGGRQLVTCSVSICTRGRQR